MHSFCAILALVTAGWLSILTASEALAAAPAGLAEITLPGQLTPLDSGGSATPYGVALPPGASCPGDTAHRGYHVFSYLVPRGVSPTVVSFKTGVPSQWFGYISDGAYYGASNTAENTGEIVGLPTEFTWSRLTEQDLFQHGDTMATWEGGIACANIDGVVTNYWNTEIVFKASAHDPGGFTWSVAKPVVLAASAPKGSGLWIAIVLLVVALALSGLALGFRHRRSGQRQNVSR